jgi:phospholipase C
MMVGGRVGEAAVIVAVLACCNPQVGPGSPDGGATPDAGSTFDAGSPFDAGALHCPGCAANQTCDSSGVCRPSPIQHVVLIVQENHSFDSYFGHWCTAPAGSNPSCTTGRACCEAAPATEPKGASPGVLDDASNLLRDRDHERVCEVQQIHGGLMDQFVSGASGGMSCLGSGPSCSDPLNWVIAETATVGAYWTLADQNALADRYFQSAVGGTGANNIYFAGARFRFDDEVNLPTVAAGMKGSTLCDQPVCDGTPVAPYAAATIADLLLDAGYTFAIYADGFQEAVTAAQAGVCTNPADVSECPYTSCILHPVLCHGCLYDPADIPFLYFSGFADSAAGAPTPYEKDFDTLQSDLDTGKLPNFAFVKMRLFRNEHPNLANINDGVAAISNLISALKQSSAWSSTLVLLTWDEGGGFFDHVPPPPAPPVDVDSDTMGMAVPYGTRVPFIAIGPFAAAGRVSHVTLEHSSVVRFIELNFLGATGQLQARDAYVNNLGSLLDRGAVGYDVP